MNRSTAITLKQNGTQLKAQLRRLYWPRRWDLYLHSFEYLQLSYRSSWFWWQVRQTIRRTSSGLLGWPLASITYYEPQPELVACYDDVENELEAPEAIIVEPLLAKMPSTSPPHKEDLESLAKIAFPTTYAERVVAAQYGAQKTAKRKVQRAAPKKTMARGPIKKKKQRTAISGRQKTATRRRSR
ncbi:MAG: hypothetical protein K0Q83_2916 [Deltaproteobacteria bacterium]|nr:hypothetical protein [Deltaproteobacteria bacterium]